MKESGWWKTNNINKMLAYNSTQALCLQDTCRLAAPESRCGLEVQQTSVQQQTHLLCPFSVQFSLETIYCFSCRSLTESLFSIFHLDTTRREKKNFLISLLHRHLTSFNECPRVFPAVSIWNMSVNGIAEKPWAILKTSIKPAWFRRSSDAWAACVAFGWKRPLTCSVQ